MKDNIVLYISGLHSAGDDDDCVEMIYAGRHFFRNGKHFIKYQESLEEGMVTDNMIKISPEEVEQDVKELEDAELVIYLRKKLNRPMRVCGVAKKI